MRTPVRGWRWRHSPLRRRSDVVEAWTVLIVTVLLCAGAPLVGLAAAWWAHDEARAAVAQQRAERHRVRAEVVGGPAVARPQAGGQQAFRATVRWTEPGQMPRTVTARVPAGVSEGDMVTVWVDSRGRSVPPPADGAAVWQHSVGIGAWAAGGTTAVILLVHRGIRGVAQRRRLAEWERAWALTEPQWTRREV
ncbi:hypothetical protein N4P33_31670 [Streptomyces sp. 15-116A]|uniref:Rv1733c family protein n=1 Tax=Streptomyces sp. 15-116A TaxID=2259035 RepID=UPI0021B4C501|nr:hypothetical protein [Streptomyces sp. 15-116A]MCT7356671.1 hypothetical protein [Streptomyces sp. 15-116A]